MAVWAAPTATPHPPLHTTPLQPPARLRQRPRANGSVAPCRSLMNSAGFAHLGGPKALGCGQRWRNGGATVEEVSEQEWGDSPAVIFLPCSVAPALVCRHAAASLQTEPSICHSSTSDCLSTLNSLPLQSPLPLPPRIITTPTITTSSGPSRSPMSRSACQNSRGKRRRRPALQTPRQSWGGERAREPGAPGVCLGAGPSPAC